MKKGYKEVGMDERRQRVKDKEGEKKIKGKVRKEGKRRKEKWKKCEEWI